MELICRSEHTQRFNFGVITVAPFAHGPDMHEHAAEDDSFYVLDGELTLHGDDGEVTVPAGTFVLAPPGVRHTFSNPTRPAGARRQRPRTGRLRPAADGRRLGRLRGRLDGRRLEPLDERRPGQRGVRAGQQRAALVELEVGFVRVAHGLDPQRLARCATRTASPRPRGSPRAGLRSRGTARWRASPPARSPGRPAPRRRCAPPRAGCASSAGRRRRPASPRPSAPGRTRGTATRAAPVPAAGRPVSSRSCTSFAAW